MQALREKAQNYSPVRAMRTLFTLLASTFYIAHSGEQTILQEGFEQRVSEQTMKRLDEGKPSLVEFMRSIRYPRHHTPKTHDYFPEQLAGFVSQKPSSQADAGEKSQTEEKPPVRGAN
jgi:hypothetical protein